MKHFQRKDLLFLFFPKLRLVECSWRFFKWVNNKRSKEEEHKNRKMKLYMKLGIASGIAFFFIIIFGFVAFPKLIKSKVKKMVVLTPGSDIREMFLKVPFPLEFRVYLFNVTNHMDVQKGELPRVQQVGPFCYEEWKEKVEVVDKDDEDVMFYKPKDTFLPIHWPGCLSGDETIIMPHPLILGMVNTVVRQKPNTLSLIGKAINSLYSNPDSIFVTAKARELIFEGVVINCGVKDFAGKAVCSELKSEATGLKRLSDDELLFSFLGPNNATAGKKHKVFRGAKVSHDVGRVIEYDDKKEMEVWPTKLCNKFLGTDGTIFPPYLTKQEGLASFSPALCRSLVATYVKNTNYDGMPVSEYTAGLGDQSKNADEKCYCPAPDNCLKKGLMDLYKCSGIPLYASLPHFLDSDESYVKGVVGLEPNKTIHSIVILFERQTGSPVFAKKRLQFSMPLERNAKIPIFKELPELILPLFWIEEGVALNNTYTKPIKDLFMVFKVMTALKWLVLLASLGGMGASGYLFYKKGGQMNITPVHKVQPSDGQNGVNGISTVMHGNSNSAMYGDESEKY